MNKKEEFTAEQFSEAMDKLVEVRDSLPNDLEYADIRPGGRMNVHRKIMISDMAQEIVDRLYIPPQKINPEDEAAYLEEMRLRYRGELPRREAM